MMYVDDLPAPSQVNQTSPAFVDPIDRDSPLWRLAVAFHRLKCPLNHTDRCGFGWERQYSTNYEWIVRADRWYRAHNLQRMAMSETARFLDSLTEA